MKSAVVIASAFATLALATPIKRDIATVWVYETVTQTVTGGQEEATPAPSTSADGRFYGVADAGSQEVPAVVTTTEAPVAEETFAPAPISVPSVPAPDTSSPKAPNNYAQVLLDQHNIHRANHSAPSLSWSSELAAWAEEIGNTCVYGHSKAAGDGEYGQNIGAGSPPEDAPNMITNSMYNGEVNLYRATAHSGPDKGKPIGDLMYGREPDMENFGSWGHFSQIVWANTKEVGCATVKCGSLAGLDSNVSPYFTVCNYRPSGNYGKQYAANVLAPLGKATVAL